MKRVTSLGEKLKKDEIPEELYLSVFRYCMVCLGAYDDAYDITQEVFLTYLKKKDKVEDEKINSWLYGVAWRKIIERKKEKLVESKHFVYDEEPEKVADGINSFTDIEEEHHYSDDEILILKEEILKKLSPEELELFYDFYEKGIKCKEIAKKLGISTEATSARIYRVRKKIDKMVKKTFIIAIFVLAKILR